jgi:predicted nucleic acid-binding protein
VLVVDATVALAAAGADDGLDYFGDELVAPPLMWSESRSVLHEMARRGEIDPEDAMATRMRLERGRIRRRAPARLGAKAWDLANELGWAKTYDAEYVALAGLLKCRLVTLDARLRRGAARLGYVVGPDEL